MESDVWKSFKASIQEDVLRLKEAGFQTEEQESKTQEVEKEGNIFCSLLCVVYTLESAGCCLNLDVLSVKCKVYDVLCRMGCDV